MLHFNAAEISDHEEKGHSITRFIAGLTADQAKACIEHELRHSKRQNVLALLSSQVSTKTPVSESILQLDRKPLAGTCMNALPPKAQAEILNALQLARAHVRCPLEGTARTDLVRSLDSALALFGLR